MKSKNVKALRNAAWALLSLRRKLANSAKGIVDPENVTEDQKQKIRKLLNQIRDRKDFIEAHGLDVNDALRWASNNPKQKTRKRKRRNSLSAKPKSGGVGMYSLGSTPRFWKS